MNRDDIIRMAREVGISAPWDQEPIRWELLERFAALVAAHEREGMAINGIHTCHSECQRPICVAVREAVAAEREECAKTAEAVVPRHTECGNKIAKAIRERGAP
jgi:hypothetical protein